MKHLFTALLTFSAFTNFLHAESMEEVVVTSSLLESSEINNPLYVIDGDDINDGATTSLGEAVDSYLGVSIADYGSAVGQPIIRGMSGPRVKILKNGMVNRDVSGLGVDHLNDLDLNNISQVEIVKGPSSLLYANGSIGGIINVVDDCIAEMDFAGSEFSAGYEKQSVNDGNAQNFNFKDNLGGFNVNFGYSKIELGNYDVPDGAILHEEDEHEGEEEHEEHEPTSFMSASTEYGAIFDLSNDNMTQKVVFNVLDEDSSIIGEEAFMNPATSEEFTVGYFMSKDIGMYNVDFGFRMDQIERSGSVTDNHDGEIEMDYYNIDDTTNSFAVALGRSLSDNLDVNLGFASVERLPSVIELFMNGPHLATGRLEVGDPNLKSETSNNFDVTFDYENGDFFAYASFYINEVDNYITLMDEDEDHDDHGDEDHGDDDHGDDDHGDDHGDDHDDHGHGNLIHSFYVQENAEFVGYELEFGRTVSLASGDLTYSFGRDQVNAEFADGHNVPRINPARNVYSLSYEQNDTVFKINLKSVERQNDFGEGETATDSYRMLDTRVTKTFSVNDKSSMKVTLFANNLLDDVARNHSSFVKGPVPLPGRNVGVKFNLTF